MYRNPFSYRESSEKIKPQFSTSRNPLGIGNPNFIWDRNRNQLIILVQTSQMIGREINALLNGSRLILEAPMVTSYDKPLRTHLLGRENMNEFEESLMEIGFSEIKLKNGYKYSLISCQVIDPNLIKVILGFRPWGSKKINYRNLNGGN